MPTYTYACPECCCTDCTGVGEPSSLNPCCDWWGLANLVLYVENFSYGGTSYGNLCFTLAGNGCGYFQFEGTSTIRTETGLPVTIPATTIDYRCTQTSGATNTWHARFTIGAADLVEFSQLYSCGICAGPSTFNPVEWISDGVYGSRHFLTDTFGTGGNEWSVTDSTLGAGSCCNCVTEPDTCVPADPETWTGPACCPWQTLVISITDPDGLHAGSHALDYQGYTGGGYLWASRSCCVGISLYMFGDCDGEFKPQWRLIGPDSGLGFTQQIYSPSCCELFFVGDGCGRQFKITCSDCGSYDSFLGGIYCVDNGAGGRECDTFTAAELPPASPAFIISGPVGQDPGTSVSSGPCTGCDSVDTCSDCCGGSSGVPLGATWSGGGDSTFGTSETGCCAIDYGTGVLTLSAGPTLTLVLSGGATYSLAVEDCCGTYTLPLVSGEGDPTQEVTVYCCQGPGEVPTLAGWTCNPGSGDCARVYEPNTPDFTDRPTCEATCLKHGYACLPLTGCTEGDYDTDDYTVYNDLITCRASCTVEGYRCALNGNYGTYSCEYYNAWPDDGTTTYSTLEDCEAAECPGCGECFDIIISGMTCIDVDLNGTHSACPDGGTFDSRPTYATSDTFSSSADVTSLSPIRITHGQFATSGWEVSFSDQGPGGNVIVFVIGDPWDCTECVQATAFSEIGCSGGTVWVCPTGVSPPIPFRALSADQEQPEQPKPKPKTSTPKLRNTGRPKGGCGCRKKT